MRGQAAPLSPNEEITLRRIALAVVPPDELPVRAVARLQALALVKRVGDTIVLTPLGKARYEALPRATTPPAEMPNDVFRQSLEAVVAGSRTRRPN